MVGMLLLRLRMLRLLLLLLLLVGWPVVSVHFVRVNALKMRGHRWEWIFRVQLELHHGI